LNLSKKNLGETFKNFCFFLLVALLAQFPLSNATAVTYPDIAQVSPSAAPFLVSIWSVDADTFQRKDQICSGVLFNKELVITAAHCVIDDKGIAVIAGQVNSNDRGEVLSVYKWVTHPRYSKKTYQNDIAIGLLNFSARNSDVNYLRATPSFIKNQTRLYGWGVDQNEIDNGKPMSVLQNNYSSVAKKYYKNFNSNTQIAAGYFDAVEKVFAGACYGDSGGPLIASKNNQNELLGIVSYGSGCDVNKPTIYTKVNYYYPWIASTFAQLVSDFKADNTTRPDVNSFSLLPNSTVNLERKTGNYGYYTSAPLQSGGGVKSPDIYSIMFQSYAGVGNSYGINFYLTNELDPCVAKQKGSWLIQVALDKRQNIDFQFSVPTSYGCYTVDKAEWALTQIQKIPPSPVTCSSPSVKPWNSLSSTTKINAFSFGFGKGCLASATSIWIRVLHSISGDGADLEPGSDMWAGPFSTAIVGQTP
jgi:secreted trypsin-like serine protease